MQGKGWRGKKEQFFIRLSTGKHKEYNFASIKVFTIHINTIIIKVMEFWFTTDLH